MRKYEAVWITVSVHTFDQAQQNATECRAAQRVKRHLAELSLSGLTSHLARKDLSQPDPLPRGDAQGCPVLEGAKI